MDFKLEKYQVRYLEVVSCTSNLLKMQRYLVGWCVGNMEWRTDQYFSRGVVISVLGTSKQNNERRLGHRSTRQMMFLLPCSSPLPPPSWLLSSICFFFRFLLSFLLSLSVYVCNSLLESHILRICHIDTYLRIMLLYICMYVLICLEYSKKTDSFHQHRMEALFIDIDILYSCYFYVEECWVKLVDAILHQSQAVTYSIYHQLSWGVSRSQEDLIGNWTVLLKLCHTKNYK